MHVIHRGAEAILYIEKGFLVKDRIKKSYRIPEIDRKIRVRRTRREKSLIEKAGRAGVLTPHVIDSRESKLIMVLVKGEKLKDVLNSMNKNKRVLVSGLIGKAIAKLHSADIIHGDMTTSNMILTGKPKNEGGRRTERNEQIRIVMIDFGMGKISKRTEDKAVDLFLFYQTLKSTHFEFCEEIWEAALNIYKQNYLKSNEVLNRLEKIRRRRRYS